MASCPTESCCSQASRRPARDLIEAVVDNMRKNLEPLKYSTLAPSRFTVYMHPTEYARLEGIIPILESRPSGRLPMNCTAQPALADHAVARAAHERSCSRKSTTPAPQWQVEFRADPDGDMNEGDLLIDSELVLPARPELGVGERTRRITTVHTGHRTTTQRADGESCAAGGGRTGVRTHHLRRHLGSAFA